MLCCVLLRNFQLVLWRVCLFKHLVFVCDVVDVICSMSMFISVLFCLLLRVDGCVCM